MAIRIALVSEALFWLPRFAVLSLALTALLWIGSQTVGWFRPQSGDPVPEFEVVGGSEEQRLLLARLLQAEFTRIKGDLTAGVGAVDRQLDAWSREFEDTKRRREMPQSGELLVRAGVPTLNHSNTDVIVSQIEQGVDLARVSTAVENLRLLSNAINQTSVPDIKIATVELGPVLRWLMDLFRTPSANKVVIFDTSSAALIEGPIIGNDRAILEFDRLADGATRTARQMVEPIAYHILFSKLASSKPKIDFGGWQALRDFVIGTRELVRIVSPLQPELMDPAKRQNEISEAAQRIESAGVAAREWRFIVLASFLFERSDDFSNAIRLLERRADLAVNNQEDERDRQARLDYLRERRVEAAVSHALTSKEGGGAVFFATTAALAELPPMMAAKRLHRLGGAHEGAKAKVALVGGGKQPWFGLDRPPDTVATENVLDLHGAVLAQVLRALSPTVDIMFVSTPAGEEHGTMSSSDLFGPLQKAMETGAEVILLPFGPFPENEQWEQAFQASLDAGQLVIVPSGNINPGADELPGVAASIAAKVLVAESIGPDGKRSDFSAPVEGALGAVGSSLPSISLFDAGPAVVSRRGTSYAAATLAAIAAETVARQPNLRGAALRDALLRAARKQSGSQPPTARVAIPP